MHTNEFICPVCGRYIFEKERDYEICPVCGWENDGFYEAGGANRLSLEGYREKYEQTLRKEQAPEAEKQTDRIFGTDEDVQ